MTELSNEQAEILETFDDKSQNFWTRWGMTIEKSVDKCMTEGDRENAHFSPRFADWLMEHIAWLPLWSSIKRDNFGYGRVPASSASVESDFNHLKNRVLNDVTLPIRADDFLEKHLNFLRGNMSIVDATAKAIDNSQEPSLPMDATATDSETLINHCPICADGIQPTAHFCVVCRKGVHIVFDCSIPVAGDEEGYGQKRLCKSCQKIDNNTLSSLISSQEIENWRGLGRSTSKKKKSYYLRNDFHKNEFIVHEKIKSMPIIKNGHDMQLKAIRLLNKNISLTNTCGFDSLFQVCLCALQDRQLLREYVQETENDFLQLVSSVQDKGLSQHSYRLRAQILSKIFPGKELPYDVVQIDCRVTAGTICSRLFKCTPSFEELSKCSANCTIRRTSLPIVTILVSSLTDAKSFHSALEDTIILKGKRSCSTQNCRGFQKSTISRIGKL